MANKDLPNYDRTVRPRLVKLYEDAGITSCELTFPTICQHGFTAALAHSKKRVDWYTLEDLEDVIVACSPCHALIEHLGKRKVFTMKEIVDRVRAMRVVDIPSLFGDSTAPEYRNGENPGRDRKARGAAAFARTKLIKWYLVPH